MSQDAPARVMGDSPAGDAPKPPIFVDLDGALVRSDLFVEALIRLIKANPLNLFRILAWLFRGRAVAKTLTAFFSTFDASCLPYDDDLIAYLRAEKAAGRPIVLATAAHRRHAVKVARHLGLFDDVIATTARDNVKGAAKLARIRQWTGGGPFTYIGNGRVDRPLWNDAATAGFINAPKSDVTAARRRDRVEYISRSRPSVIAALIRGMRPHQWVKNILVVVPLVTSHQYVDASSALAAFIAFVAFSLGAAGVYLLNDLLDLDADRRHDEKRLRPLASGALAVEAGIAAGILLPAAAILLGYFMLPAEFAALLLLYLVATTLYSLWLKSLSTVDVITLAGLYTLRIVAGAAAIGVALSFWLLAFSMFFFLSLAYLKRYCEVKEREDAGAAPGRGYSWQDAETMFSLGTVNGVASILVVALYVQSDEVAGLYPFPEALWFLCPILLYWINRVWIGARRGKISQDPLVFAVRDRISILTGALFALVIFIARYGNL